MQPHRAVTRLLVLFVGTASAQDSFTARDLEDAIDCRLLLSVTADGAVQLAS